MTSFPDSNPRQIIPYGSSPSPNNSHGSNIANGQEFYKFLNKVMNNDHLTNEYLDEFYDNLVNNRLGTITDYNGLSELCKQVFKSSVYKNITSEVNGTRQREIQKANHSSEHQFSHLGIDEKVNFLVNCLDQIALDLRFFDTIEADLKNGNPVDEKISGLRSGISEVPACTFTILSSIKQIQAQRLLSSANETFADEDASKDAPSYCQTLTTLFFNLFEQDKAEIKTDSLTTSKINSPINSLLDDFESMSTLDNADSRLSFAEWKRASYWDHLYQIKSKNAEEYQSQLVKKAALNFHSARITEFFPYIFLFYRDFPLSLDNVLKKALEEIAAENPKDLQNKTRLLDPFLQDFSRHVLAVSELSIPENVDESWKYFINTFDFIKSTHSALKQRVRTIVQDNLDVTEIPQISNYITSLEKSVQISVINFMSHYFDVFGGDDRFPKGEITIDFKEEKKGEWTLTRRTLVWDLATGAVYSKFQNPVLEDVSGRLTVNPFEDTKIIPLERLKNYVGVPYKINVKSRQLTFMDEAVARVQFTPIFTYQVAINFMDKLIDMYDLANPT